MLGYWVTITWVIKGYILIYYLRHDTKSLFNNLMVNHFESTYLW